MTHGGNVINNRHAYIFYPWIDYHLIHDLIDEIKGRGSQLDK